jgi:hypothetical protein
MGQKKMTKKQSPYSFLSEWNRKIYRNEDDSPAEGNLGADEFWDEFQIKSWPKFKDACAFHIPGKWASDVRELLKSIRSELGNKVSFTQIKEKFCELVIYCSCEDEETRGRFRELQNDCVRKLIEKGVHPPTQEKEND